MTDGGGYAGTSERAFHAYGEQMRAVTDFRYLGRVLTNTDDDWLAVAGNIRKARASWGRLARVLGREGAAGRGRIVKGDDWRMRRCR